MKKQIITVSMIFAFLFLFPLKAKASSDKTYLLDTPTAMTLDYGSFDINGRFFRDGGLLTRVAFGVLKNINIGVSWEVGNVIGIESLILSMPSLYVKARIFGGNMNLPAIASGYDGQGYYWNKDKDDFEQKEKGVFIDFEKEIFLPDLMFNLGFNVNDFKDTKVYMFTSLFYDITDAFYLFAEGDNIFSGKDWRMNTGIGINVTEGLSLELNFRDLFGQNDRYSAERIVRVNYKGRF